MKMTATSDLLTFQNKGQTIASTNYWDSTLAHAGFFVVSWNAGAARLLVPDVQKPEIREMRTAKYVIVSRGPWHEQGSRDTLELLFEDDSDSPYSIWIGTEHTDRLLPARDQGDGFIELPPEFRLPRDGV